MSAKNIKANAPLILIVDDVPDNLALMSDLLCDYKLKVATNGEVALRLAAAHPQPDLILLDLMMPGIDGYEVCRRLKANPETAGIPVIFLTARAEIEDEEAGLQLGAVDYIAKPISPPIVLARVRTHLQLKQMTDLLQSKNTVLESELLWRTHHDALTNLPNRTAFTEHFAQTVRRAEANKGEFAVFCLELRHLKEINDVFGYAIGDALLRLMAERLAAASQGAFLSRHGGDEFALIVEDSELLAALAADRLQATAADEITISGHRLRVGLSVGIALYPVDGTDAVSLMGNAGAALYRAKEEVADSVRFYEASMDNGLRERRALGHDLRPAIERGDLVVFYQPQAGVDRRITGFEALVRWPHPTRGFIQPDLFIPVAEETGLILALGEQVLRTACREAASWPNPLGIAVNLSPLQFRDSDLVGVIQGVLRETGLAPERLELEITESVLIGDPKRVVTILRRLKAMGVKIAIDDFGTGYSSLSTLQAFPFDKMKIDRSFIVDLERPHSSTIVRAVIGLGRGLGLPVLAEGVETAEQLDFLIAEGCSEIQGYMLGRPEPIEAFAALVGRAT